MPAFFSTFFRVFVLLLLLNLASRLSAQAEIIGIEVLTENPRQYDKFELSVTVESTADNFYDYDKALLEAFFTSPDGQMEIIEGFYYQDFQKVNSDALEAMGDPHFRLRFSPRKAGNWQFRLKYSDEGGSVNSAIFNFFVTAADPKGFLQVAEDKRSLRDAKGRKVSLIGENIPWTSDFPGYDPMAHYFAKLSENDANFAKLMLTPWGYHLEWSEGGLRNYGPRQQDAFMIDSLFRMANTQDLFLQLAFSIHNELNFGFAQEDWSSNPYNIKNGGFCTSPQEFFSDVDAKAAYKNRMRYILARWGYAKNLAAWEIFSETDNFPFYSEKRKLISQWVIEMAEWLQQHDPYDHLVSAGYALPESEPLVWKHPAIDFTQLHLYNKYADLSGDVFRQIKMYIKNYDKPVLVGEFGLGHISDSMAILDSGGIALHNALWTSALTGSMGTVVPWYWEEYIDRLDLYAHFGAVARVLRKMPEDYANPVHLQTQHETRDDWTIKPNFFSLTAASPSRIFEWHSTGQMVPSGDSLNCFLYGPLSIFAGLRNPPSFKGNFTENTVLVIETGNQVNHALLQVTLDQTVVFEKLVEASKSYFVEIPAGFHQLRLDNMGAGFASVLEIEQLILEDFLPKIRAFGLLQEAGILAWIHHRDHNWKYLYDNNQLPEPASAEVVLPLKTGAYRLDWYNTGIGTIDSVRIAEAVNGSLNINLPPMQGDLALIANFINDVRDFTQYQGVVVYPNPSKRKFTFAFELEEPVPVSLEIVDLHGRIVFRTHKANTKKGVNQITWKIDQPGFGVLEKAKTGLYIYRLVMPKQTITGKLMVTE
ncbi:MAG: T9SS type A sorting domain-containing protein [Bacteroidales bacterium]|jgi:hypothetical protein|nr:T9SS type A sorting domain-containing protein [Bacteroidales bacterium]